MMEVSALWLHAAFTKYVVKIDWVPLPTASVALMSDCYGDSIQMRGGWLQRIQLVAKAKYSITTTI